MSRLVSHGLSPVARAQSRPAGAEFGTAITTQAGSPFIVFLLQFPYARRIPRFQHPQELGADLLG